MTHRRPQFSRSVPWLSGVTFSLTVLACTAQTDDPAAALNTSAELRGPAQCSPDAGAAGSGAAEAATQLAHGGHHRHHHPRCGNGVVEQGEQCDDGNRQDDDGCSATCRVDDDLATPGDDRPGLMECAGESCATDGQCCGDASAGKRRCVAEGEPCMGGSSNCDGPEDCSSGQVCWEARWALCSPADSHDPRGAQRCHRDEHCASAQTCVDGLCRAASSTP